MPHGDNQEPERQQTMDPQCPKRMGFLKKARKCAVGEEEPDDANSVKRGQDKRDGPARRRADAKDQHLSLIHI